MVNQMGTSKVKQGLEIECRPHKQVILKSTKVTENFNLTLMFKIEEVHESNHDEAKPRVGRVISQLALSASGHKSLYDMATWEMPI